MHCDWYILTCWASSCAQGQWESCQCINRNSFSSANLLTIVDKVDWDLVNPFWRNVHFFIFKVLFSTSSCDIWRTNSWPFYSSAHHCKHQLIDVSSKYYSLQYIPKSEIYIWEAIIYYCCSVFTGNPNPRVHCRPSGWDITFSLTNAYMIPTLVHCRKNLSVPHHYPCEISITNTR